MNNLSMQQSTDLKRRHHDDNVSTGPKKILREDKEPILGYSITKPNNELNTKLLCTSINDIHKSFQLLRNQMEERKRMNLSLIEKEKNEKRSNREQQEKECTKQYQVEQREELEASHSQRPNRDFNAVCNREITDPIRRKLVAERREQERLRRKNYRPHIDLLAQAEIMRNFEESFM